VFEPEAEWLKEGVPWLPRPAFCFSVSKNSFLGLDADDLPIRLGPLSAPSRDREECDDRGPSNWLGVGVVGAGRGVTSCISSSSIRSMTSGDDASLVLLRFADEGAVALWAFSWREGIFLAGVVGFLSC
jgi:hypothetical protein